ncbi:MAG TPA: glycosyltransferase family protein [Terriglobales bacterium]|nr:glycosyltransferase family protein [Terriglobales bacterium]
MAFALNKFMQMERADLKIVAIIQARMGSSRLPGKVLMDIGGETVLGRVVRRSRRSRLTKTTVVATTELRGDDAIVKECQRLGVRCFRGMAENVLDRYYRAALEHSARLVVRVTSDNPLVDPDLIDETVMTILKSDADYANNRSPRIYPEGLDVEAFTFAALERAQREARQPYDLEHVTPYFYQHPEKFHCVAVKRAVNFGHYRWTLDTAQDLQVIREIYGLLGNRDDFSWLQAIEAVNNGAQLASMGSQAILKALHAY